MIYVPHFWQITPLSTPLISLEWGCPDPFKLKGYRLLLPHLPHLFNIYRRERIINIDVPIYVYVGVYTQGLWKKVGCGVNFYRRLYLKEYISPHSIIKWAKWAEEEWNQVMRLCTQERTVENVNAYSNSWPDTVRCIHSQPEIAWPVLGVK
jgi:hypothetical protein